MNCPVCDTHLHDLRCPGCGFDGQRDVYGWYDVTAVAAGFRHSVALKQDGTLVSVGSNISGQRQLRSWTDVTAIAAGDNHLVGLRSDGTLLAVGENEDGQCDVDRLMPELLR